MSVELGPRHYDDGLILSYLASTPVVESPHAERGRLLYVSRGAFIDDERQDAVIGHPITLLVLQVAAETNGRMDDPSVQLQAVLRYVEREARRQERSSVRGMREMIRGYELRADHYHALRWCEQEANRHAYGFWSPRSHSVNVYECWNCGMEATAESLASAGVRPGGR